MRQPEAGDLENLNALILRSKAVHGYDAEFMAACTDELGLTIQDLKSGMLVLAEDAEGLVGVAQVARGPTGWSLEKLFVEPARISTGAGRILFGWAAETARSHGSTDLFIEADPGAVAFYRHMGAMVVGDVPSGSVPGRMLPLLRLQLEPHSEHTKTARREPDG